MSTMNCPACGTENPVGFRFCGQCGGPLANEPQKPGAKTMFFGAMQRPNRAKLVLIKGEGLDGMAYHLNGERHVAGRTEGEIRFADDPLLSPTHAAFYYEGDSLVVEDQGSVNGVFVRITAPEELGPGDRFLVGEQLIAFEPTAPESDQPEMDDTNTCFYGSPRRPGFFKLVQILRGGNVGMIFRAPNERVSLGREGNDINFPDDPFISGQHAMVGIDGQQYLLSDLGSKNGTFLRIAGRRKLEHGDYVFVGQQLLRVEIS